MRTKMKLAKTLRKISSISLVGTLATGVLAGALNFDAWKSNLPAEVAQYKIVLGSTAKATDVLGAVELAAALQYYAKTSEPTSGTVTIEREAGISGAISLYKDTEKLELSDPLNNAISVVSEGLVFGTKTFKDKDGDEYTYTLDVELGTAQIVYEDKPDTDEKDPTLMIKADYDTKPVYTLRALFTSPVDTTKISSQEIELFGKKYYFKSISGNVWTLYEAAKETTLKAGESIEFDGKTVKLVGVSKEVVDGKEYWGAVIDVDGTQEKLSEGENKEINGVYVTVIDVYELNNEGYAKILLGGQEVTFDANSGVAKIGDTELRNVKVLKADSSGLKLAVFVSDDNNKNYIEAGKEFVDPIFGTFKVVFSPVDLKADKAEIKLVDSGDTRADLVVTDHRGYTKTLTDAIKYESGWKLLGGKYAGQIDATAVNSTSGTVDADDTTTDMTFYVLGSDRPYKVEILSGTYNSTSDTTTVKYKVGGGTVQTVTASGDTDVTVDPVQITVGGVSITVDIDADDDGTVGDTVVSTTNNVLYEDWVNTTYDKYVAFTVSDTERYLLRIRTIDVTNNEIEFEDVFSGQTFKAGYDASGYGKLVLGGKEFWFHVYDETNRAVKFLGKEGDYLVLSLKDEKLLKVYTDTDAFVEVYADVDGDRTYLESGDLEVKADLYWNSDTSKIELKAPTLPSGITAQPADTDEYKALTTYGTYVEYKTGDDYYFRAYVPKEKAWYDIKLAPTEATTEVETKTLGEGDKIPGTEWVIKSVTSGEKVVLTPLTNLGVLDTKVEPRDTRLIVIGGPAVNALVKHYVDAGLVSVPESGAVVKLIEEDGKVVVVVAGADDVSTAKATVALARYLLTGDYAEKFDGTDTVVFTPSDIQGVTFAAVEGIVPTSELAVQPPTEEQPTEEQPPAPGEEKPTAEKPTEEKPVEAPTAPAEQPTLPAVNWMLVAGVVAAAAILGAVYFLKFRK